MNLRKNASRRRFMWHFSECKRVFAISSKQAKQICFLGIPKIILFPMKKLLICFLQFYNKNSIVEQEMQL
jgi:hypothetical protein